MNQQRHTITITITDESEGKIGLQVTCEPEVPEEYRSPAMEAADLALAAIASRSTPLDLLS